MNLTSNDQLTYFAHDWTDKDKLIGLAQPDRRYHFYTLGRSGMGKSTMLFSKIVQDLQAGRGLALIDPHGDLAEAVLPFVPKERAKNLVYLNPTDDYPISLNPLDRVGDLETHLVADNLLAIFHKIWADSWGPRLSYVQQRSLVALIENHRTLLALPKLLTDAKVAKKLINKLKRVYGFKKKSIFIADAAYDEKDMYNFIVEQLKCQAFIPINPRNTQPEKTFGPKGLPLCDADLEMKSNGKCKEAKRERIKFRCPLKTDKTIAQKYPEGLSGQPPAFL